MNAFATIEQYDARFPGRTVGDATLQTVLEDATLAVMTALDKAHVDYSDPTEDFADRLARVTVSVADRLVPRDYDVPVGVTQASMSAVGFSESYSYSQRYGTGKLLDSELDLLGIRYNGRIGWAQMGGRDD
jgi:hypothetical protein